MHVNTRLDRSLPKQNESLRRFIVAVPFGLVLLLFFAIVSSAMAVPDFTFIHASDVHAPWTSSRTTIAELRTPGPIQLTPYNVTSDTPSFAIVTGDLTEFGYGRGWDAFQSYWKDVKLPVYLQSGNHDGTWDCLRNVIRERYGSTSYSFDKYGCHFIGLDTASPQDPRPSITVEQLTWLRKDLAKVASETPVFLFCHHPLGIGEFAGMYERDEMVDILRPYNVVLILAGHGHGYEHMDIAGIDLVMGGSTAEPTPGYNVVSVKNNVVHVAYKKMGESAANTPVFEKVILPKAEYPSITITGVKDDTLYKTSSLSIQASISSDAGNITAANYTIDDAIKGEMATVRNGYGATINLSKLTPGAHYLRTSFQAISGRQYQKSKVFYSESNGPKALWRVTGLGSYKGAPAVARDTVYIGGTDGRLCAFRRRDGKFLWAFKTSGDILCQPLVTSFGICFGSGDGKVYSLSFSGKLQWTFQAKRPVYSSPVLAGHTVIIGGNDACLYALDDRTGKQIWANRDAQYTIECKPFIQGDTIYYGAWDKYLYAVDVSTGKLKWKSISQGVAVRNGSAEPYYSPADCGPVATAGKVFAADRNYKLSIHNSLDGSIIGSMDNCAAVGLSEDGKSIYLRRTDGRLTKIDTDGKVIWEIKGAGGDSIPAAPTERDGIVYLCSKNGWVRAFSSTDGSVKWEYQATPQLYVFGSVEARDGIAYVAGMDGHLTAICQQKATAGNH